MAPLRAALGLLVVGASLVVSIAACGGASRVAPVGPPPEYETPDGPVPVAIASTAAAPSVAASAATPVARPSTSPTPPATP